MDVEAEECSNRVSLKRNIDDVYFVSPMWSWYVVKVTDVKDGREVVVTRECSRTDTTTAWTLVRDRTVVEVSRGKSLWRRHKRLLRSQ